MQSEGRRIVTVGDGVDDDRLLAAAGATLAVADGALLVGTLADLIVLSDRVVNQV